MIFEDRFCFQSRNLWPLVKVGYRHGHIKGAVVSIPVGCYNIDLIYIVDVCIATDIKVRGSLKGEGAPFADFECMPSGPLTDQVMTVRSGSVVR